LRQEAFDEEAPSRVPEAISPREARRDREIADALRVLLALAEYGIMVNPIWCPFPRITSMHAPLAAGDDCHQSLTFTASTNGNCPADLYRLAHQNTRGICELLRRTWCTRRPLGYAVDTFLSYPSALWLAAVAEADRTGQPPGWAQ
jgi:hypothetical protein